MVARYDVLDIDCSPNVHLMKHEPRQILIPSWCLICVSTLSHWLGFRYDP